MGVSAQEIANKIGMTRYNLYIKFREIDDYINKIYC